MLAGAMAAVWIYLLHPETAYFFRDADGGFFIQGAYDWRTAGLIPQIDVHSSYGPLSFALRWPLQALTGDRLVAEVLLAVVGYGISYAVLFWCFQEMTNSRWAATLLLLVALLCVPRYYKFPVVLIPALATWSALLIARAPLARAPVVAAGIALAIAMLFRHDYLVYATAVVAVGWARGVRKERGAIRQAPIAILMLFVMVSPWLATISATRGLKSYILEIAGITGSKIAGLGLPHPIFDWQDPAVSLLFVFAYALPLTALVWHLLSRHSSTAALRDSGWIGLAAGIVFLPQSMHRADYGHLLQVVPGCLLALAGAWQLRVAAGPNVVPAWPAGVMFSGLMLGSLAAIGGITVPNWRSESFSSRAAAAFKPASQLAVPPAGAQAGVPSRLVRVLQTCAPRGRTVAIYPFGPQLAYFAGRVHGGAHLVLAPGYFDDEESQSRAIDALARDRVALILWDESFLFDGRRDRHSLLTHAKLHKHVVARFARWGKVDGFTIYADPDSAKTLTLVEHDARCL